MHIVKIYDKQKVTLRAPFLNNKEDIEYFKELSSYSTRDVYLKKIKNVYVNHESLIFKNGEIRKESFVHEHQIERYYKFKRRLLFLIKNYIFRIGSIKIKHNCLWIIDNYSDSYYHWLIESLPRLILTLEELKKTNSLTDEGLDNFKLFVALPEYYKSKKYVLETLSFFDEIEIIWLPFNKKVKIETLILCTQLSNPSCHHPYSVKSLNSFFLSKISKLPYKEYPDKIYISRNKSSLRMISNEEEMLPILEQNGFKILHFEEIPFSEQVNYCNNAKYIFSIHGAGLANIVFMKEFSTLIELRNNHSSFWDCFYKLASLCNIEYFYLKCPVVKMSSWEGNEYNHGDISVNPIELKELLHLILKNDFKNY